MYNTFGVEVRIPYYNLLLVSEYSTLRRNMTSFSTRKVRVRWFLDTRKLIQAL